MHPLTTSEQGVINACPQKWVYRYKNLLRLIKKSAPLRIGSAFTEGVRWYEDNKGGVNECVAHASKVWLDVCPEGESDELWAERVLVESMVYCYITYWRPREKYIVVETEKVFVVNVHGVNLAGSVDAVLENSDGQTVIRERKTTGFDIDDLMAQTAINPQITNYWLGLEQLGLDVIACEYDVAKKPAFRPKKISVLDEQGRKIVMDADGNRVFNTNGKYTAPSPRQSQDKRKGWVLLQDMEDEQAFAMRLRAEMLDSPETYFRRELVYRDEYELRHGVIDLQFSSDLRRKADDENLPCRNTHACYGRYGACDYLSLCKDRYSHGDDPIPDRFEVVTTAHVELEEERYDGNTTAAPDGSDEETKP